MLKKLNCIIIEDEIIFRKSIESFVSRIPFLNLIGSYESPFVINNEDEVSDIDIAFLDILTPGENGLDFGIKLRKFDVQIIFTTSNSDLAIQAFNIEACDYLIKPFEFSRFERAVKKATSIISLQRQTNPIDEVYGVKFKDIIYFEKDKDYLCIHHDDGELKIKKSLRSLIDELPLESNIIRIHKSFAVNKERISKIERDYLVIDEFKLPLSRNGRTDLVQDLKIL